MVRGVISILPRATSRIAATTSAAARDLWMKALAPDWTAAKRAASESSRVKKIIFASGRSERTAAAASGAVPSGRRKSRRTTSGWSSLARDTASATVPAWPTTLMSVWLLMSASRPSATTLWSSTIITRIGSSSAPDSRIGFAGSPPAVTLLEQRRTQQYLCAGHGPGARRIQAPSMDEAVLTQLDDPARTSAGLPLGLSRLAGEA